jgi:hypothetical protein
MPEEKTDIKFPQYYAGKIHAGELKLGTQASH